MKRLKLVWGFIKGTAGFILGLLCMIRYGLASKDAQGFYDKFASRYDSVFGDDAQAAEEMIKNHLVGGLRVLDLACGTGITASPLLRKYSQVFGVDISRGMLSQARAKPETAEIRFVQGSFTALPFRDESFDAAICVGALWHLKENEEARFVNEIFRILKSGGMFITTVQSLESQGGLGDLANRFTNQSFIRNKVRLAKFNADYIVQMFSNERFIINVSRVWIREGWRPLDWPIVKIVKRSVKCAP